MKKLAALVLPLVLFLASCGMSSIPSPSGAAGNQNVAVSNAQPASPNETPQEAQLRAQAFEDCRTYQQGATQSYCEPNQRQLIDVSGRIFSAIKSQLTASERVMTIGATFYNGNIVVTVNGSAAPNAKTAVRQQAASLGYAYLTAGGTDHAEIAIYKAFGTNGTGFGNIRYIGISNPSGPCSSCQSYFAGNAYVTISWLNGFYW